MPLLLCIGLVINFRSQGSQKLYRLNPNIVAMPLSRYCWAVVFQDLPTTSFAILCTINILYTTFMDSSSFLVAELHRLAQLECDIRASGTVAEPGWAIDTSGGYARARPPRIKGKAIGKTIALGKVSGAENREWQRRIQRRNALQEIARRAVALQAMIDNPIQFSESFTL